MSGRERSIRTLKKPRYSSCWSVRPSSLQITAGMLRRSGRSSVIDGGEAKVIPVVLRPCEWHGAPFGKLQALPKDGKAVTSWTNKDEAWTDVALGIRRAIETMKGSSA